MSTIAVNAITDANAGNTTSINGVTPNANNVVGKNKIINGNMAIDQRNAGASVTPTTNATYTLDRWNCLLSVSSKFSTQQSSIAPPGFSSSNLITSLSSYSSSSGDYFSFRQQIEGFNTSDLGWGTAEASPVTLSFWVRSSLTGSFGGSIISTGASNYSYPFLYTINSANTWEQISVSVPANTFNAPNAGNASALEICFDLGTGSGYSGTAGAWANSYAISATGATSVVGTSGATFYITGVQLEAGSVATEFEHRPYGMELSLCQRYYQRTDTFRFFVMARFNSSSGQTYNWFPLPLEMRASPTVTTDGNFKATSGYTGELLVTLTSSKGIRLVSTNSASASGIIYANEGELFIDAEL